MTKSKVKRKARSWSQVNVKQAPPTASRTNDHALCQRDTRHTFNTQHQNREQEVGSGDLRKKRRKEWRVEWERWVWVEVSGWMRTM
jgi:ribosomal protein L37E